MQLNTSSITLCYKNILEFALLKVNGSLTPFSMLLIVKDSRIVLFYGAGTSSHKSIVVGLCALGCSYVFSIQLSFYLIFITASTCVKFA